MSPPRALLVDAGGTLLQVAVPVARTYAHFARRRGHAMRTDDVQARFLRAVATPWEGSRYADGGHAFWRFVVRESCGTDDPDLYRALYAHYAHRDAWKVAAGGRAALHACRRAGVKTAIVSNWDARLRPLLGDLGLLDLVDCVAISAEVGSEKPDPELVLHALAELNVPPERAVLIGDSGADRHAAAAAGCEHWNLPDDVVDFAAVQARILGHSR